MDSAEEKKNHQICPSMTRALLNQNKNKEALRPYKNGKNKNS